MKLSEAINNALQCIHSGDRVEAGDLEWWIQMAQKMEDDIAILESIADSHEHLKDRLSALIFDYQEWLEKEAK